MPGRNNPIVSFRPYEPWHLDALEFNGEQHVSIARLFSNGASREALDGLYTRTTFVGEDPRGVGGIHLDGRDYGIAWAFPDCRLTARQWLAGHRETLDILQRAHLDGVRRIECFVRLDFPGGHRWAKTLGFSAEGVCRARYGDAPHILYGRTDPPQPLGTRLEAMLRLLERTILEAEVPRAAGALAETMAQASIDSAAIDAAGSPS